MIPVAAPRFDLEECKSEAERAFIEALHARAEAGRWFADSWRIYEDRLTLCVSPCDDEPGCNGGILRTLRVDFDGTTVRFGPDETHQFVTELDPARAGVSLLTGPIAELANAAADWLEREMRRPIVRQEWDRLDQRGVAPRKWMLADTGEALCHRGEWLPEFGPPDRVVPVSGYAEGPARDAS